jgi:DNA-binding FrmR family transcriptional regulator
VYGYTENKDSYLLRLRRIEGQVRGLQRMVEDDKYCIDILTQVAAVTRALQSVALGLLDEHLSHCVTEAVAQGGDAAEAKVHEAGPNCLLPDDCPVTWTGLSRWAVRRPLSGRGGAV